MHYQKHDKSEWQDELISAHDNSMTLCFKPHISIEKPKALERRPPFIGIGSWLGLGIFFRHFSKHAYVKLRDMAIHQNVSYEL